MSPLSRSATGVLVSDPKGRDIKIDAYTLSFHGRLLIEGAEIALNYGQRYGLLGDNGSGKVCLGPIILRNNISPTTSRHSCSPSLRKIYLSRLI
jgi:ATPase subunit of ABC transporter with duplicated ATPase domains